MQTAALIEQATVDAIARAEKSVVAIVRLRRDSQLFGRGIQPTEPDFVPSDYGTGVVIDRDGLILTNYHVIGDPGENDYYVWTNRKPYRVTAVKGADPWTDLAVLKIDADDLEPISFGDTTNLRKGQIVVALGNPYAIARDGQVSASWGIISNLARKTTKNPTQFLPSREGETLHHYGTLIQTDARLDIGTSGGALINLKGEMVGLTSSLAAMERYEQSAGFAIPVDEVFKKALEKLKNGQSPDFGFLGVVPTPLKPDERRQGAFGVRIERIVDGTPAAVAGLRANDIITHLDSRPIYDHVELMRDLGKNLAGETVTLTVKRRGESVQKTARLSKKYINSAWRSYSQIEERSWRGLRIDYATATAYFQHNSHNMDPKGCVAIVEVDRDSPAWKAGLRPNTFLSFVEQQRVSTPDEFFEAVAGKTAEVRIRLTASQGSVSSVRTVLP